MKTITFETDYLISWFKSEREELEIFKNFAAKFSSKETIAELKFYFKEYLPNEYSEPVNLLFTNYLKHLLNRKIDWEEVLEFIKNEKSLTQPY